MCNVTTNRSCILASVMCKRCTRRMISSMLSSSVNFSDSSSVVHMLGSTHVPVLRTCLLRLETTVVVGVPGACPESLPPSPRAHINLWRHPPCGEAGVHSCVVLAATAAGPPGPQMRSPDSEITHGMMGYVQVRVREIVSPRPLLHASAALLVIPAREHTCCITHLYLH